MQTIDVVVIGGGASGLVAAIYAARKGKKVTILEKNKSCGKKILITGNGKCNYWNSNQSLDNYHTNNIHNLTFQSILNYPLHQPLYPLYHLKLKQDKLF